MSALNLRSTSPCPVLPAVSVSAAETLSAGAPFSMSMTHLHSHATSPVRADRICPQEAVPAVAPGVTAVFTLDPDLRVESMNAAAALLVRQNIVAARPFATRDHELNSKMRRWLRNAAAEAELRLRYRDGQGDFSVTASRADVLDAPGVSTRFVVLVQEEAAAIDRKLAKVARDHGLTHAEQRVAERILAGENTILAARRLGVAPATVRTHLQRIMAKTDTHRQSEFACLVARYVQ
ncbi:helix-turn-helix transcriptional regulator [Bosea vestrisii]|uniref:helix-turn-helix transcriptional regulator n=1 Tax=Bosea vestrisii TaxID=151416 RepID=UPI0024DF4F05|nr:helix-turn-helix transcriptional regulator [Bosea vestrisii]WID98816.1 helix-turn-helix transcriptional regulator [Bosea vestrisii]